MFHQIIWHDQYPDLAQDRLDEACRSIVQMASARLLSEEAQSAANSLWETPAPEGTTWSVCYRINLHSGEKDIGMSMYFGRSYFEKCTAEGFLKALWQSLQFRLRHGLGVQLGPYEAAT